MGNADLRPDSEISAVIQEIKTVLDSARANVAERSILSC